MNKIQRAYMAGIVDGEGYIGILRVKKGEKKVWSSLYETSYIPVIKVAMTDKPFIEWLYKSFGGTFETRKAHGNARESYCWTMRKAQVLDFVRLIYPYLVIKKKHAEILLRFPKGQTGKPIGDNVQQRRLELCNLIRELTKRGAA